MNLFSVGSAVAGITALFFPVVGVAKAAAVLQVTTTALNDMQSGKETERLEHRIDWEVNQVREEIRKHDLSKDPRFLRSVETAVQLSLQTMQDDKIDLYARILTRATAKQGSGVLDTAPVVMRIVSAATSDELRVLRHLQARISPTRPAVDSRQLALDLGDAEPNVSLLLSGMAQLGLVRYLREKTLSGKRFGVWDVTFLGQRVDLLTA